MSTKDDWRSQLEGNTARLSDAVHELEGMLNGNHKQFWEKVKGVSALFKDLKPTSRDERERLWTQFGNICSRAKSEQERERERRLNVSKQKRATVELKLREAYDQARGAGSGKGLKTADELLEQAMGWMKDGYSGFGTGTRCFAMNDGKMLREDHEACFERWKEIKDLVRSRREEISSFNYGHFKAQAYEAKGLADDFPKDAKAKVRDIQAAMKGQTMERWQFDELRDLLDEVYRRASAASERRHQEWQRKQEEYKSRLRSAKSRKLDLLERNRSKIQDIERQIDKCRDMLSGAKSPDFENRVQGWIDEKYDKIRDIERFNRELEGQLREVETKLSS